MASLGKTINQLLDENLRLSREIYETKLQERDIHCQYLQIRLKSHFLYELSQHYPGDGEYRKDCPD